jgi:hypothetical protein
LIEGSQPQTPRSTRSSKVDEAPGTPRVSEPATPRSKLANGSIPGTPKESNAGNYNIFIALIFQTIFQIFLLNFLTFSYNFM